MTVPVPRVAAVLVSHDGARWLPTVIDGIAAQTAPLAQVVAVDTNSVDESARLLRDAFGEVQVLKGATGYPAAVQAGVNLLGQDVDWIWLLHDDANPAPTALAELLAAAESSGADLLGPKLREWPSLRRLLELGVTISGTGRRETGLERGEYDQGQHDEVRAVLAVNTAGLLIRRSAWEALGGLDDNLPIFGNDIDLGWRAARAGLRTIIVPRAVVFHAEAAHRGVRRTQLTGRHTHFQERRAALYTLLANARPWRLPFQLLRLLLGTLLRAVGFIAIRSLGEALDEVAALLSVYSRPGRIHAARRARAALDTADPAQVRALLAPPWLPYRHGLDAVGDLVGALTNSAADIAERRRAAAAERDPASFAARNRQAAAEGIDGDGEALLQDTGAVARFLTNPVAVLLAVVVALLLVGTREALGTVVGDGLSPTPAGVGDWWRLHLESWHAIGQGSDLPAPPYLLPLTLLGTLLTPGGAVSTVMLLSAPLGLWGAWRLLRVIGRLLSIRGVPRWLILWGATAYALVPLVAGAWSEGRLGPVVAAAVLPWLVHAALGFADPEHDRRVRAGWRTGLLLALVTAFTPIAWPAFLLLTVVVLVVAAVLVPGVLADRSHWLPPLVALLVPVVLLAAWWLPLLLHGGAAGLLLDAGVPPMPALDGAGLALGRLPDLGAPWWLGVVLPALAVVALVPARTRVPVLVCWLVGLVAALTALALSPLSLRLGALSTPAGTSFLLVLAQGAAVVAIVVGAQGALAGGVTGWRRGLAAVLGAVAAIAPLGGLAWVVVAGHGSLSDHVTKVVPAYMLQAAEQGPEHGVLVLRGDIAGGIRYEVVRDDGTTLGEDEIAALTPASAAFTGLVRDFVSRPGDDTVAGLAAAGIQYVVQPAPADPTVAATIDATSGLTQASAQDRATRAWQVEAEPTLATTGHRSWLRLALLVVQLAGLLAVLTLCAPTMERGRRRPTR
ncbi:glycosyltransferase [Nocardioides sp.]|uniref:glycosyltransferase n=1 Tax=Nocardioides sp. TaxID=35761 RepID=UPI0039E47D0E